MKKRMIIVLAVLITLTVPTQSLADAVFDYRKVEMPRSKAMIHNQYIRMWQTVRGMQGELPADVYARELMLLKVWRDHANALTDGATPALTIEDAYKEYDLENESKTVAEGEEVVSPKSQTGIMKKVEDRYYQILDEIVEEGEVDLDYKKKAISPGGSGRTGVLGESVKATLTDGDIKELSELDYANIYKDELESYNELCVFDKEGNLTEPQKISIETMLMNNYDDYEKLADKQEEVFFSILEEVAVPKSGGVISPEIYSSNNFNRLEKEGKSEFPMKDMYQTSTHIKCKVYLDPAVMTSHKLPSVAYQFKELVKNTGDWYNIPRVFKFKGVFDKPNTHYDEEEEAVVVEIPLDKTLPTSLTDYDISEDLLTAMLEGIRLGDESPITDPRAVSKELLGAATVIPKELKELNDKTWSLINIVE